MMFIIIVSGGGWICLKLDFFSLQTQTHKTNGRQQTIRSHGKIPALDIPEVYALSRPSFE